MEGKWFIQHPFFFTESRWQEIFTLKIIIAPIFSKFAVECV